MVVYVAAAPFGSEASAVQQNDQLALSLPLQPPLEQADDDQVSVTRVGH
jgi:hypothetical protein